MSFLIGIGQPTGYLIDLNAFRISGERKRNNSLIPFLLFHLRKIDRPFIDTCRCSGLETEHLHTVRFQRVRQVIGRLQSVRTGIITYISIDASRLQIRSGTQNNCLCIIRCAGICFYSLDRTIFYNQFRHFRLFDRQMWCILQYLTHGIAVIFLVCLGTQGMDCRSFGFV